MSDMRPLASAIRFVIWFPMLMMFLLMAVLVAASWPDREPAPRKASHATSLTSRVKR